MDMGTGKTKVAIDYAGIQEQLGNIEQALVVCPLSAMGVWNLQILEHSGSDTLRWKVVNYDRTFRYSITRRDKESGDITSITEVDHFTELAEYLQAAPTLIVFDEGHALANPNSKRTKASYVMSRLAARVLNMTGTPIRSHPLDQFSQYRNVDEGILGGSWGVFKRTYAVWGGYGGNQLIKLMNQKQLFQRLAPYTYTCKLEDCVDMPKRGAPEIVPVSLQESRKYYDRMAAEALVYFEDIEFSAPMVLTRLLRLSQLTGGHLVGNGNNRRVGREKERVFKDLMQGYMENEVQKVVVYMRFIDDLRTVASVCKDVGYHVIPFYGKIGRDQRDRFIAHFEESKKPTVFASQIATGSLSISLTPAHDTVYYSLSYDYVQFEQSMRRTWRPPQKMPCNYKVLMATDTVDEYIWVALRTKHSVAQLIHTKPELIPEMIR
jgi:SNF2 family DNA or RNA helicase